MTLLKLHSHHVESEKAGKEVQKHQHDDDSNSSSERAATNNEDETRRGRERRKERSGFYIGKALSAPLRPITAL